MPHAKLLKTHLRCKRLEARVPVTLTPQARRGEVAKAPPRRLRHVPDLSSKGAPEARFNRFSQKGKKQDDKGFLGSQIDAKKEKKRDTTEKRTVMVADRRPTAIGAPPELSEKRAHSSIDAIEDPRSPIEDPRHWSTASTVGEENPLVN